MSLNVDIKILCDQSLNKLFSDKNWENQKNKKIEKIWLIINFTKVPVNKTFTFY